MLVIYANEKYRAIIDKLVINQALSEVVRLKEQGNRDSRNLALINLVIEDDQIMWPIDWFNQEPPILIDDVPFNESNLLCMIYGKLHHFDLVESMDESKLELKDSILMMANFTGYEFIVNRTESDNHREWHNQAIQMHYGMLEENGLTTSQVYQKALELAPDKESAAFTTKNYVQFLLDDQKIKKAEQLLRDHISDDLSMPARVSLCYELINCLIRQIKLPYNQVLLSEIKQLIAQCLSFYENYQYSISVADLLIHASEIANIDGSYSESLGYINRAIQLYEEEELPELLAWALLRKATLLYTWAQANNPQFFKTALETYQQVSNYFSRESNPVIYAEIQHHLAVIYTEIPTSDKQKVLWSAVSASAFKECLDIYDKESYPYEHAMAANNYANALMKYPEAKNSDNVEKAIYYYNQALTFRNAEYYPRERVHTILNYLEACWRAHNVNQGMERLRFKDMSEKVNEILTLTTDPEFIALANEHKDKLKALRKLLVKT